MQQLILLSLSLFLFLSVFVSLSLSLSFSLPPPFHVISVHEWAMGRESVSYTVNKQSAKFSCQ